MTVFTVELEVPSLRNREESFRLTLRKHDETILRKWRRHLWFKETKSTGKKGFFRLLAPVSITLGSLLLTSALWPIISYFLFVSPNLEAGKLVSPLPDVPVLRQTPTIATAQAAGTETIRPKIIQNDLDYTDLSSWFGEGEQASALANVTTETKDYVISIPSLDVEDAVVKIGGTNLDNNLIQYPGTAEPGQYGAPVVFGHSILRQFYNPSVKNSRRYMSIFSKIMTLKPGDKIYIDYDNIRYTYSVIKKVEVKPSDTYILEQEYSAKQLKLITCVPEGTYLRRGVVLAQLETVE
jgi:sortase A